MNEKETKKRKVRGRQFSLWVLPADDKLVDDICMMLETSKGDAVRSAIRVYHAILVQRFKK